MGFSFSFFLFSFSRAMFSADSGDVKFGPSKCLIFHNMINRIGQFKSMNPWSFRDYSSFDDDQSREAPACVD